MDCPNCGHHLDFIPDGHFVEFDEDMWMIEHDLECRLAGTLGTCKYINAIRMIVEDGGPDLETMGRWRITDVDDEGLPSLERVVQ